MRKTLLQVVGFLSLGFTPQSFCFEFDKFSRCTAKLHFVPKNSFFRHYSNTPHFNLASEGGDTGNEVLEFLLWLQQNGADTGPLYVDDNCVGNSRGLKAAEYIPPQSTILEIPFKLCITDSDAQFSQTPLAKAASKEETWKGLNSVGKLAMALLNEKQKGPESFYHPYIALFPPKPPVLLTRWTERELAELQDDFIVQEITKPHQLKEQIIYNEIIKAGQKGGLSQDMLPTPEEFQWAIDMVRSRGFTLPDPACNILIPMIDMLNSDVSRREVVFSYHKSSQTIKLMTACGVPPNYEVFNNYGEMPNAHYLLNYGYVPDKNPFECIKSPGLISDKDVEGIDASETPAEKMALMVKLVKDNEYFEIYEDQIQPALIDGLRLLYATEDEYESVLERKWTNALQRGNSIISRENESLVASALRERCNLLLTQAATSLDDDLALLEATKFLGGNGKLALIYRLYRKTILRKLQDKLSLYSFSSNFKSGKEISSINEYLQNDDPSLDANLYFLDDDDDSDDEDDVFF